jgi:hypothetical protein
MASSISVLVRYLIVSPFIPQTSSTTQPTRYPPCRSQRSRRLVLLHGPRRRHRAGVASGLACAFDPMDRCPEVRTLQEDLQTLLEGRSVRHKRALQCFT